LPIVLWPLSFIVLKSIFIYALLASVTLLALFSLRFYGKTIPWKKIKSNSYLIAAGIIGAIALYLIFYFGNFAAGALGIGGLVGNVYQTIYGNVPRLQLIVVLIPIAIFEEIYWRGALQAYLKKNWKLFASFPWVATTIFYTLVHLAALNLILLGAAFLVGLVTSLIAEKYGIMSSIITHLVWIELIVVFLPVMVR
jgi:uncharacterized protein